MLTLPPSVRIYLAIGQVDMRRGHDGLAAIVHGQWKLDLYAGHLFVFLGRRADRCKILFWIGAASSCTTSASNAGDSVCHAFPPTRPPLRSTPPSWPCCSTGSTWWR